MKRIAKRNLRLSPEAIRHKIRELQDTKTLTSAFMGGMFLAIFPMIPGLFANWETQFEVPVPGTNYRMNFGDFFKWWFVVMCGIAIYTWDKQQDAKRQQQVLQEREVFEEVKDSNLTEIKNLAEIKSNPVRRRRRINRQPRYLLVER